MPLERTNGYSIMRSLVFTLKLFKLYRALGIVHNVWSFASSVTLITGRNGSFQDSTSESSLLSKTWPWLILNPFLCLYLSMACCLPNFLFSLSSIYKHFPVSFWLSLLLSHHHTLLLGSPKIVFTEEHLPMNLLWFCQ